MSREYPGESRLCGAEEGEEAEGRGSVAEGGRERRLAPSEDQYSSAVCVTQ